MNIPTTYEALIIIALIFVPGIILSQLVRSAIAFYPETVNAWHFIAMGAVGLFLHALVFPFWTRYVVDWYIDSTIDDHWQNTYAWFIVVIFIWPVLAGVFIAWLVRRKIVDKLLDKLGMSYVDRTPTAWDWAVRVPETRWIRVYLNDGKIVAGWYGKKSFSSLYHSKRDIYLEQMWLLDDEETITEPQANTDGVWISHEAIRNIVFQKGQENGQEQLDEQPDPKNHSVLS